MLNTLLPLQYFVGDKLQTNTCYKQGLQKEDGDNDYDASLISTKHKKVNIIMIRWEKHLFIVTHLAIFHVEKALLAISRATNKVFYSDLYIAFVDIPV